MIDWEQKKELVKAINHKNYKEIEKFVNKHIENFDCQAWDMLAFAELIQANYTKDFLNSLKNHYKKAHESGLLNNLSILSAIRLGCALGDTEEKANV